MSEELTMMRDIRAKLDQGYPELVYGEELLLIHLLNKAIDRATSPSPVEGQALPPLPPAWKKLINRPGFDFMLEYYTDDQMQAYARQAIEADRRGR